MVHLPISKSCDPQLLKHPPAENWDLKTLVQYCRAQGDRIDQAECSLAVLYWRLGAALAYARRHFDHGQWSCYLEQLSIDRTRASKARAIFRTFRSEQFVAGLSVDEAYSKRKRKQKRSKQRRRSRERSERTNPNQLFCKIFELVVSLQTSAKQMSATNADHFLSMVRTIEQELLELREQLEARIDSDN